MSLDEMIQQGLGKQKLLLLEMVSSESKLK